MRWTKIINCAKRWKRIIHRHRERGEKKFTTIHRIHRKVYRKYAVKIILFSAFHRISYENLLPNLDPGISYYVMARALLLGVQKVLGGGGGTPWKSPRFLQTVFHHKFTFLRSP